MNRYIKFFLLGLLLCSAYTAKAQIYEIGFTGGMSSYMGDLNSKNLFHRVYGGAGVMLRYNHDQHVSARLNAYYSMLRGSDMRGNQAFIILPNSTNLKQFEFETDLIELSFQVEINFLPFITGNTDTRFSPYLFGGLGSIYFNPAANSNAHTTNPTVIDFDDPDLDPAIIADWGNELKPGEYSNFSIISLFGYGFKYNLSENFIAGIEWGMRYAGAPLLNRYGTDYLDMVSLKGNPKNNDWYSVLGFTFTYKFLDRSRPPCPNHNL